MDREWRFPLTATAWLITAVLVNVVIATAAGICDESSDQPATPATEPRPSPLAGLNSLASDLALLQEAVADLTEQATALTALARDIAIANTDLSGPWELSLPAGFHYTAEMSPKGEGQLELNVRGVMRGTYARDGRLLRMALPTDPRLTEFVWEATSADRFVLIESPPVAKIGSDYRGATLTRVDTPPAP